MFAQAAALDKKPHIIIATPGRLVDHLQSNSSTFSLRRVKFVVLDEADRLILNPNLWKSIQIVLEAIPNKNRQTLLFSATMEPTFDQLDGLLKKGNIHKYICGPR